MENNNQLCEKLETAIFSGDELSEELNNHAQSCERCRRLTEQSKAMWEDLKKLDLTGIGEGKIADAVMQQVRTQNKKTSVKFNFTHHLGTAAAMVIICAVALYVKNFPTEVETESVKYTENAQGVQNDGGNSPVLENTLLLPSPASKSGDSDMGYVAEEEAATFDYYYDDAAPMQVSDEESESENDSQQPETRVMMKSAPKRLVPNNSDDGTNGAASDVDAVNEAVLTSDAPVNDSVQAAPVEDYTAYMSQDSTDTITEEAAEESGYAYSSYTDSDLASTGSAGGGGGAGGGSSGGGSSANQDIAESEEAGIYSDSFYIFDGIEFAEGEDNLDINISIANSRLSQLYGEGFCVISRYALENNGWNGNAFFFNEAPTMTYNRIISVNNSSSPICG